MAGKRVLITGGAVRLGCCIGEMLSARGCQVVVHYHRSAEAAQKLVERLKAAGTPAFALEGQLDDEAGCRALMEAAVSVTGGIEVLVNNASTFNKDVFLEAGETRLQSEIGINALAPMYLTRAFAVLLPSGSGGGLAGKVINLLDRRVAGEEQGMMPYLLSKKMLHAYTRIAALELGPRISVNAVAPGPVLPPPGQDDDYLQDHAGAMVLGVRPTPEDIARAVLYLLEADAVTGQTLYVDSGQHLL